MEYTDIKTYFINQLQIDPQFADIDTSDQSNFSDLVIKPHVYLAKVIFDYVDYIKLGSSLNYAEFMSKEQLDLLATNWFVKRKSASLVNAEMTIVIANGYSDPLEVSTSSTFTTSDGITFSPTQDYVFLPNTLPVYNPFPGANYRIARFLVVSSNATRIVGKEEISTSSVFYPGLVSITNEASSSAPLPEEDNLALTKRMFESLTMRNNVTNASLTNNLQSAFPAVANCYAIGFGDPEMQRDIAIAGKCWSYHAGGMIDVYVRTDLKPTSFQVLAQKLPNQNVYRLYMKRYKGYDTFNQDKSNPHAELLYGWEKVLLPDKYYMREATVLPELPLLFINVPNVTAVTYPNQTLDTLTVEDIDYDVDNRDYRIDVRSVENYESHRFSIYEQLEIDIHCLRNIGEIALFTIPYWTINDAESMQSYLTNDSNQFKVADTILKSFIPVEILNLTVAYNKNYTIDEAATRIKISDRINTWALAEPLSLSTLLNGINVPIFLSESGRDYPFANAVNIDTPSDIPPKSLYPYTGPSFAEVKQYNIDGTSHHYYSTKQIGMLENFVLSASKRTVRYFIIPDNIKFVGR